MRINPLFSKLKTLELFRSQIVFQKLLRILIGVILAIYVYFILAFSNRAGVNHYTYYVIFLLSFLVVLYILLYGLYLINMTFLMFSFFSLYVVLSSLILNQAWSTSLTMLSTVITLISVYFALVIIGNKFIAINFILLGYVLFSVHFYTIYFDDIISLNFGRLGAYFYNQNKIAFQMLFASSLCWFLVINVNQKLYVIPFLFFGFMIYLTGSRTFAVILPVFMLLSLFFKYRRNAKKFLLITLIFGIALMLIIQFPQFTDIRFRMVDMLKTIIGLGGDVSTSTRVFMAQNAAYIGIRNLFFGIGTDGFSISSQFGTYSHNNLFEILANFGLPNVILFYYIPGVAIFKCFRSKRTYFQVLGALLSISLILSSFGTVFYHEKTTAIIYAFIILTYM